MATRKWGNELLVNTTTTGIQHESSVTALADGGFVITWRDNGPTDTLIRWQRYDAAGVKLGAEQTITQAVTGDQSLPDVVQLSDGNLWFIAQDFNTVTDDDIDGWVFTPTGTFVRFQSPQASTVLKHQDGASASLGANGSVAVYHSPSANTGDIKMTLFNGAGTIILNNATVNSITAGIQFDPEVAASPNGTKFVVTWRDVGTNSIRARVFDNAGTQTAAEFQMTAPGANAPLYSSITWLGNDRFVATWSRIDVGSSADSSSLAIKYTIFNANNGTALGAERLANSTVTASQKNSAITALPDGGFVIAWEDLSATGGDTSASAIRLQVFDGVGDKRGGEILVNTTTFGDQLDVSLATLADGRVIVSWTDGGTTEIRAQIIDPRDGIIDGTAGADTLYGHDAVGDVMSGFGGIDTMYGLAGADVMYGGDGADRLEGGRGDDTLFGGNDADTLLGGLGADELDGGAGTDVAEYRYSRAAVTVNLATGFGFGGDAEGDTLAFIETVVGSNFADNLTASRSATTLYGAIGDDVLLGGAGADNLIGGAGADTMNGAGGIDTAFYSLSTAVTINLLTNIFTGGEAQGDILTNIENIRGGAQGDTILGNGLANIFFGFDGADRLGGGTGIDTLHGGKANDTFVFALGDTGQTAVTADSIGDYAKGIVGVGDKIDFTSALVVGGTVAAATASQASINATTGIATFFAGSGTTMADALVDIATSINQGTTKAGEFAFFKVNQTGNFHLFISDGVAGVGANDVLVQLTNITTINTINLMAGDLTILT